MLSLEAYSKGLLYKARICFGGEHILRGYC